MLKRFFDFTMAFILLILFLPLMILTAILIRFRLGAPILFKQQRPGWNKKPFYVYKFRTMARQKDSAGNLLPDAERLTKLGKWLRKYSLDELPQLGNVLKGDMSFVGPRPLLMEYLPLYNEEQNKRHDVRPGITGLAQIRGRNTISWERRLKLDVFYVKHQSFWLDLKFLCLTFRKVFFAEGISQKGYVTKEKFKGTKK